MRFLRKVVSRGNLTLPSDIREALDIQEGDIVEFAVVGIVRKTTGTDVSQQAPSNQGVVA